jgi:hypothetical protein
MLNFGYWHTAAFDVAILASRKQKIGTNQLISITLATSPWHSEHKPTSNKSPALTAPEKLVIVTS